MKWNRRVDEPISAAERLREDDRMREVFRSLSFDDFVPWQFSIGKMYNLK